MMNQEQYLNGLMYTCANRRARMGLDTTMFTENDCHTMTCSVDCPIANQPKALTQRQLRQSD